MSLESTAYGAVAEQRLPVVTALRTGAELKASGPRWNRLCEGTALDEGADPLPFVGHDWVSTWWECFGGDQQLEVLLASEPGIPGSETQSDLLGLAPLLRDRVRMHGIEVARVCSAWNEHTPRLDLLLVDEPEACCRAFWDHLEAGDWDLLQLPQLPDGSDASRLLGELAAARGLLVGRWPGSRSPYLPLTGSWADLEATLSPKFRWRLRNVLRRAQGIGAVELEIVESPNALDEALAEGFRLEAAAWKGEAGSAISSDPRVESFYRLLAYRAALQGRLELHFLRVGGRRVAFGYCLRQRGVLYCLKGGYDPAYAHCSPCNLLISLVLRSAAERGLREYDFVGDSEPWKREWTAYERSHHWLFAFRPTVRTRVLHLLKFHLAPMLRSTGTC
jgi:CelD/BcsL family acetyltransferase involved in cellulose biosynthesis